MTTLDILKERVRELEVALDNMRIMNVPQRLICDLFKLSEKHKLNPKDFALPHTKGVLALRVGIEAETLSRAVPRLVEYGVRMVGPSVRVDDAAIATKKVCDQCAGRDTCKAFVYLKTGSTVHN